jgi:4-hydroxy-tetrahydrodipicolinate reductase
MAYRERVIVNGLPGRMATKVARRLMRAEDFDLHNYSLTGDRQKDKSFEIGGSKVHLYNPSQRVYFPADSNCDGMLTVDYTLPGVARSNAYLYLKNNMPFVMGTTGGDLSDLQGLLANSSINAVVGSNMALPIVSMQRALVEFVERNQFSLSGCELTITESHQSTKKDTSGTAKAMVSHFNRLGIDFDEKRIVSIRDRDEQMMMGVPEEFLSAHGWHTYEIHAPTEGRRYMENLDQLQDLFYRILHPSNSAFGDNFTFTRDANAKSVKAKSLDGSVSFEVSRPASRDLKFVHNINGRAIYAEGTLTALRFLRKKMEESERGKVFSMVDVLNSTN